MSLLARLRRPEVLRECRHCGTNVRESAAECPTCGGAGFATYVIDG